MFNFITLFCSVVSFVCSLYSFQFLFAVLMLTYFFYLIRRLL